MNQKTETSRSSPAKLQFSNSSIYEKPVGSSKKRNGARTQWKARNNHVLAERDLNCDSLVGNEKR